MVNVRAFIQQIEALGILEAEESIFLALVDYEVGRAIQGAPAAPAGRPQVGPGIETASHVARRRRRLRDAGEVQE